MGKDAEPPLKLLSYNLIQLVTYLPDCHPILPINITFDPQTYKLGGQA